jgi:hypothetical protein
VAAWRSAAAADENVRSYLGPAGVLAADHHAVFVSADNELAGYPAVELGWRYGVAGVADVGLEVQAIDVAVLGRLHGKVRLYEDQPGRGFLGLRLRVDFKRQVQEVDPETFRDIDDFGFVVAPELSAAFRFADERSHAFYYLTYFYLDFDVRPDHPLFEIYYSPILVGYEWRHSSGFHLLNDVAAGFELFNPETTGELILRARVRVGWEW